MGLAARAKWLTRGAVSSAATLNIGSRAGRVHACRRLGRTVLCRPQRCGFAGLGILNRVIRICCGMAFSHWRGLKTAAIAAAASLVGSSCGQFMASCDRCSRTKGQEGTRMRNCLPLSRCSRRLQTPQPVAAVEPPGFRTPGSRGSGSVESARTASAPTVQAQEEVDATRSPQFADEIVFSY